MPAAPTVAVVPGGRIFTPFGVPGGWIARYHPGDDWHTNSGIGDLGKPVCAPVSGLVVHAGWGGWGEAYGIQVIVEDEHRIRTQVAHLMSESVRVGQHVDAGDRVGKLGQTGSGANGPHVHVEQRTAPYGYWDHRRPVYDPAPKTGLAAIWPWWPFTF